MLFELFTNEGEHPRSPRAIVRRFILWSIVCWASAAPSFVMALTMGSPGMRTAPGQGFDPWAMATAIVLFTTLYTIFTSTDAFERLHRIHGVRRTLYIGYWTRIGISILFPVAMVVDMLTGLVSVAAISRALGTESGFVATFFITCLHGTIMNLVIALYMAIVFPIVRTYTRDLRTRAGFEVVMLPRQGLTPPPASASPPRRLP